MATAAIFENRKITISRLAHVLISSGSDYCKFVILLYGVRDEML